MSIATSDSLKRVTHIILHIIIMGYFIGSIKCRGINCSQTFEYKKNLVIAISLVILLLLSDVIIILKNRKQKLPAP